MVQHIVMKQGKPCGCSMDISNHGGGFQTESELVAVVDDGYDIPNMKLSLTRYGARPIW